ncbi:MAG: AMIN domain-containing protein [Candidatus Hydrogenedentes bacterium]|nr:AMIN domain-containing protein [Candidatus Hydrogenedentota bacterium]
MRTRAAAVLAVLASLPTLALGEEVAQRKETAVRTALEKQGKTGDFAALVASSTRASAISDVAMAGTLGAPEVIIQTEGRPAFEWFKLDGGKRIVIDFHNTIHLQSGLKLAPIGAAPLVRVRSSLYSLDPEFVSRIVIDLQDAAQPEFAQDDTRVTMRLRKSGSSAVNASLSERAMQVASDMTQAQQRIEAQQLSIIEKIQRAALPATLEGPSSDEITAFLADAATSDDAARERLSAILESARQPLNTQRERLDELQASLYSSTIESDKAETTLASIESEIRAAVKQAETDLAAVESGIIDAADSRAKRYDDLVARVRQEHEQAEESASIELAKAEAQPLLEPSVADNQANVTVEHAVVEAPVAPEASAAADIPSAPANDTGTPSGEQIESTIEKIERDLASLRDDEPEAEPAAIIDTPQDLTSSATALAKLDSLNTDMKRLADAIASVAASPAIDPATGMHTTEFVAMNIAPTPETVDAASAALNGAVSEVDAAVVAALAEPSPEAAEEPASSEETPASDAGAPEESATSEESAPSEEQPAPAEETATAVDEKTSEEPATVEEPQVPAEPPKIIATAVPAEREELPPGVDPLDQIVNIDFREMDLSNVVSLLAKKGQVNVIAGTEVTGTVTADIRNVPLRKAMDMVLRMNGLGIVEEEGIFRIVPYEEAVAARRTTKMIPLTNAQADDVKTTLEGILIGGRDAKLVTVSANKNTNVIIVSGPEERAAVFEKLARELDVKEPTLPTVTEAIKLNYLDPKSAKPIAETLMSEKIGKVEIDTEGRHVVVTDVPAAVDRMKQLLASVDKPVKQVAIEAMIVDAVLRDASQTGVDWTIEAIRRHSSNGDLVSDVSQLAFDGNLGAVGTEALNAGVLSLGILSSEVRLNATIAAEVQSRNAQILASPSIVTVENQPATISIVQEFPYQEITQGLTGPPVASTEFKPIGVTLDVTPRITHTNDTIVLLQAKQSSVSGLTETGVPIEDKREAQTTLRAQNGRTIFIGGLRNTSNNLNVSKIPVLGDIPVLNFMFRNTNVEKVNTELLIFLTCHVMDQELPELTATQQEEFDKLDATPKVPDGQRANFHDIVRPQDMRDPMWKWRRSNR